jgi:hypothetical protein
MMPSRDMDWKEWLFSPFAGFTYPGKCPITRSDLPDGEVYGGLESKGNEFEALVWWLRFGIRVCGLDVGVGLFLRSQRSVDKLTKKENNAVTILPN